ncbi:NAD-dependent protein deacetylase sirtuin-3, mitochondrial isoform X1 [Conger conger]|uniref:NAD-dependent protein deacetylase sirtuin-3, mitochondrial isoform X1 n=3 Tax=Conger conger TaxID=82655 RepID=UPI002A59CFF1|nr:NAD-dependent protein deacetylase sirtuin-3, mitochondrial isoform X1 [Conger conger]
MKGIILTSALGQLCRVSVNQNIRSKGIGLSCLKELQHRTLTCFARKQTGALNLKHKHTEGSTGGRLETTLSNGRWPVGSSGARGLFGRGGGGGDQPQQTLEGLARGIGEGQFRRVVVMVGAGISTPSGIPDFRSPGSGLYDNLQQYNLPYAEAIFEINYFHYNPEPFFALAKELYPGNYQPNATHYFVRLLQDKGQLVRMYTQNIDGLERMAGISPSKLVEAHGTFSMATCTVCLREYPGEELRADIMASTVPKCPTCTGVIKPNIVFFGEELPQNFFLYLTDFPLADLLIVMGTSLEVEPFASLAGAVRGSVPRLLINRDPVGPFAGRALRPNDVAELGDVVGGVRKLTDILGWTQELEALMAADRSKAQSERANEE